MNQRRPWRATQRPWLATIVSLHILAAATGCRGLFDSPTAPSSPADPTYAAERALCIEQTNMYRAIAGRAPLMRSAVLDEYAGAAARTDGLAHIAHQHARQTNSGNGLSRAENAILWWSLRSNGSVAQIVRRGLADMWQQGDGGVHYRNLVGAFTEIGCGIFVNGDEVTVVQAFR